MKTVTCNKLPTSQILRMTYIDFCLSGTGVFRRGDLVAAFGISIPQASKDMAEYLKITDRVEYDRRRKLYHKKPNFVPVMKWHAGLTLGHLGGFFRWLDREVNHG